MCNGCDRAEKFYGVVIVLIYAEPGTLEYP